MGRQATLLRVSFLVLVFPLFGWAVSTRSPSVLDAKQNVTYEGVLVNGVEKFLNIPYAQDTSGERRFSNPEPFVSPSNVSIYDARKAGPSCPQPPLDLSNQSEDCLRLKVVRPKGGLYTGSMDDGLYEPDELILQSVDNGLPVIFVAMNYRLSIFGFALSDALRANNSLNVGLKDQRLALEWVQEHIEFFGGDPDRVTIFGQSSGGLFCLSVGIQILAYGGSKPVPFHAGIMESTALEPTSTSNFTITAYNEVANLTGCDTFGDPQSVETLACMRALPLENLLNFTIIQHDSTSDQNDGDIYLPTVDDDFLPLASSELVRQGLLPKIPVIIGWTEDDAVPFTNNSIQTPSDTYDFIHLFWKGLTNDSIASILSLYPSADFNPNPSANLSSEFYRSAQIFRDILFTCPSFYLGGAMAAKYYADNEVPEVYYYIQNQTILSADLGIVHTSELAYVFGNFSFYNDTGDVHLTKGDVELRNRETRTWSGFANTGQPSLDGKETLEGWGPAYGIGDAMMDASVYVIGGPDSGLSSLEGVGAKEAVAKQKLKERCGFFNSPEVIEQLQY
ncbi:carboxylesterase family protein [Moniliophthora roreri]|nr:carboxylesterase family protein [Moniliophthora roreri]